MIRYDSDGSIHITGADCTAHHKKSPPISVTIVVTISVLISKLDNI
ncbi:hypothetical protein [Psychrobacter frigidicola]|nr:hypothetical protein [Psychrobacter frigidicola]